MHTDILNTVKKKVGVKKNLEMKKIFWAICVVTIFSCTKSAPDKEKLTTEKRSAMIAAAIGTKASSNSARGTIDVKNSDKTDFRVAFTERSLLSKEDIDGGQIHLREIVAYDEDSKITSFGYILVGSNPDLQSSSGNFTYALGLGNPWGSYTGYMLMNDGCYHHGTFYWSNSPDNYIFVPDKGKNNSGEMSTGFEDFCLSDSDFEAMC